MITVKSNIAPDFYLLDSAWDGIVHLSGKLGANTVSNQAITSRTVLGGCKGINRDVYHRAILGKEQQHDNIVNPISTLSVIDQEYLRKIGAVEDNICSFCGAPDGSLVHTC